MSWHGLTEWQLKIIADILRPYADKIEMVGLFESRVTGRYRENSDIDLVLYGNLQESDVDRLHTLFAESSLPLKVDVTAYDLVDYPPLKSHIAKVMRPLFAKRLF
jgi:uncharacterized protein